MDAKDWAAEHTGPFEIVWLESNHAQVERRDGELAVLDNTMDTRPTLVAQSLFCLACRAAIPVDDDDVEWKQ